MKKLIVLLGLVAFVATASFAQTEKAPATKDKASIEKTTPGTKNVVGGASATSNEKGAKSSCSGSEKAACCSKDKGTASAGKGEKGASCSDAKGTASAGKGAACCSKDKGAASAGKSFESEASEEKVPAGKTIPGKETTKKQATKEKK